METEILKQIKYLQSFLADEYSIIEHIKEDPHGQFGLLKSLSRKELKEYISLLI